MEKIENLAQLVFKTIQQSNRPDCLLVKKSGTYVNISSKEVVETVESLSATLIRLGINTGDRVGLLSENRPEWAFADLAVLAAAAVTVPVYVTLPSKQIEYIVNNSGMAAILVSSAAQLEKILQIRDQTPALRHIIIFDAPGQGPLPPDVIPFSQAIRDGSEVLKSEPELVRSRTASIKPEDVFTIVYTSGTTGEPKGVMLTHRNLVSNIEAVNHAGFQFTAQDRTLSFLPLSHILERMVGYYCMLYFGGSIAYAEGLESMPKNLVEVKPTVFISVPRVYEKFYSRIMDNVASEKGIKKDLADWALKTAAEYAETRLSDRAPSVFLNAKYFIADKLVLSKIRKRLGGQLRLLGSGGAALPKQLGHFFYGIGLTILEGYGLTETSPVICFNRPGGFKFGTVGQPVPGVEVRIAEDGEILTSGPHVMKGYFNKPKETSEAITPDGWFHTGDIGEIDADGYLKITDRKKDLIITSAGKNIAPQFIENMVKTSKYVTQIVVIGDKRKYPSALVVPNMENLRKFADVNRIPESEILTSNAVIEEIYRDIERLSQDLAPFERIKKIALLEKEFTIDSGELTPSLKIRRNIVEKKYKETIDKLYSEPVLN